MAVRWEARLAELTGLQMAGYSVLPTAEYLESLTAVLMAVSLDLRKVEQTAAKSETLACWKVGTLAAQTVDSLD